ncbi:MAG: PEP-CTERM sorting domain-containing protein [Colwellia sp.]|nr:PEP-CTERM sorting domain-containing protein [Colwellia sp.]
MNTLKKFITAVSISLLSFTFTASATPIDMWDWEVDSAFTLFSAGVIGSDDNHFWDDPSKISWGDASSSLTLGGDDGHFDGENLANGASALTATLTHHNFIIFSGDLLTSATLSTKLQIAPAGFPLAGFIPPLLFNIVFKETSNGATCSYGVDLEDFPEGLHCEDDIFVIDTFGTGIDFNPFTNTFNQKFGLMGYTYNIELAIDSLAELADDVCARVGGGDPGCIGITTHEQQMNSFDVNMTITLVPEPSTILLMSLALFGIVASMRNKHI